MASEEMAAPISQSVLRPYEVAYAESRHAHEQQKGNNEIIPTTLKLMEVGAPSRGEWARRLIYTQQPSGLLAPVAVCREFAVNEDQMGGKERSPKDHDTDEQKIREDPQSGGRQALHVEPGGEKHAP